jgi:Rrf2 family protein
MQLHNTTQYAIRLLSYIATHHDKKLYSAKELSEILNIPYKFLTKIMTTLVKEDLVFSIRGREGGYKLSRPASDITVLDILNIFNECAGDCACILGIGLCDNENKCALHDQWLEPKRLIHEMFINTTLDKIEGHDYKL